MIALVTAASLCSGRPVLAQSTHPHLSADDITVQPLSLESMAKQPIRIWPSLQREAENPEEWLQPRYRTRYMVPACGNFSANRGNDPVLEFRATVDQEMHLKFGQIQFDMRSRHVEMVGYLTRAEWEYL